MAELPWASPWLGNHGDGPHTYSIQVQGEVERHWELELRMQLSYQQTEWGAVTTLSGRLPDQAALLGALGQLAMWGYLILSVRVTPVAPPPSDEPGR